MHRPEQETGECWFSRTNYVLVAWSILSFKDLKLQLCDYCSTVNLCDTQRGIPVGLESGKVPDSEITVSSERDPDWSKLNARLNSPLAWAPAENDTDPWLQIEFDSTFVITAIMTQGRANLDQWVTSYTVSSSMDGASWTDYQDINTNTVKVWTLYIVCFHCLFARSLLSHTCHFVQNNMLLLMEDSLEACNTILIPSSDIDSSNNK